MPKLKFRNFQIEDYARAAMTPGCILGHDTGLGKSVAAFAIPIIKRAKRVLLVAPGSLHLQLRETARDMFGVPILPLESQEMFWQWNLDKPAVDRGKPVFYLTTYQALGQNGADEWEPEVKRADGEDQLDDEIIETPTRIANRKAWLDRNLKRTTGGAAIWKIWKEGTERYYTYADFAAGIGETHNGFTCVWTPSLARLCRDHNSFDSVVVDEGTRLQSNDAKIALGVRMLNPAHRLVLSATPIKNRLDSLFWLAWWAAGGRAEAHQRWPYPGTSKAREEFARQHLQNDRFLSREASAEAAGLPSRKQQRRTARITNIHHLWKTTAPILLRRRKADCGEDIVPKRVAVLRVKPGTAQMETYRHHLLTGKAEATRQMQLLRMAATCPHSESLAEFGKASPFALTPKLMAILTLIVDRVGKGEQVLVGSAFTDFGSALQDMLRAGGIGSNLLDGRVSPTKRGELARDFKDRLYPVMIGGLQAMGEGHSFDRCANLLLPSLDHAYDINKQFVDRIWRLTTKQPINVYTVLTEGTVDDHLQRVFCEKDESSSLALDGQLRPEDENDEETVEKLLADAIAGFRSDAPTLDESDLMAQFEQLKPQMKEAQKAFVKARMTTWTDH